MKIIQIIMTTACLLILACGSVFAIEKAKKDQPQAEIKSPVSDTGLPAKTTPKATDNPEANKSTSGKALNDFIDSNNNGIDDRSERKISGKNEKPKTTTPEAAAKKTPN